jgi:uncharacterized protein
VKLRVDEISETAKEVEFSQPGEEVNRILAQGPLSEWRLNSPISVALSYYRAATEIFFQGQVSAHAVAKCGRCAEDFEGAYAREVRFVLVPAAMGAPGETRLSAEDLEFSVYQGEEIDLGPLIREQVLLALPTRPLCRDECRGLCPGCGANLNFERCGCSHVISAPRINLGRLLKTEGR